MIGKYQDKIDANYIDIRFSCSLYNDLALSPQLKEVDICKPSAYIAKDHLTEPR
jgi:hypothetical protein